MIVTRFVLSAQLCHIPGQQVPQINEELPQCTCPCQPTLTTFRACTLSSWCLCVFPGNRQPCTYSQSSFIFCSTEGSWFLQQQRRQLLMWLSHARIPSKLPTQPFLCQRDKKSLSQPGCSSRSLSLVHAAVPRAPSFSPAWQTPAPQLWGDAQAPPTRSSSPSLHLGRTRWTNPSSASPWAAR